MRFIIDLHVIYRSIQNEENQHKSPRTSLAVYQEFDLGNILLEDKAMY